MVTNEFERDLNDQAGLKRPGRVDLVVLQNTADAGDGHPGLQRCFRNYLHEGGMEKDLDLIGYGIKGTSVNINNAELQQLSNIGSSVITASIWTQLSNIGTSLISSSEWSQIANIGGATISGAQWGYVGGADQPVKQADSPTFDGLTVSGNIVINGNVDGVDVSVFKTDYDAKINQNIKTTASPTFVGLTLSANLVTASTVDGVDVSAIKLNSMPSAANGDIDANTQKIINVVDPTNDQDVSTKKYSRHGIASDDVVFENNTNESTTNMTYTKLKEITAYISAKIRVYWGMLSVTGPIVYSKVYLNGVVVGTERNTTSTSYVYFTEDIEIKNGDLIQIYGKSSDGISGCMIAEQKIKFAEFVSTPGY